MLTGCSQSGENGTAETSAETTTAAETTAVSETETNSETEETETETEPAAEGLLDGAGDGFLTYDKNDIKNILEKSGIAERPLAGEIDGEESESSVYSFAMINDAPAEAADVGGDTAYCSTLYLGEEKYLVVFGTEEYADLDSVLPYCTENKVVEYWAFAFPDEDGTVLFPLIAGSAESGYYSVIPVFASLGMDVSGMTVPAEPLGSDYDPEGSLAAAVDGEGAITVNVTGAENMEGMVRADCTVENTYPFDAIISCKTLTVNGEDFSEKATFYFEIKSGETLADEYFYIDDCELYAGDELHVTAELLDGETYETIGTITFDFTLK